MQLSKEGASRSVARIATTTRYPGKGLAPCQDGLRRALGGAQVPLWPIAQNVHVFHLCPGGRVQWANYLLYATEEEVMGTELARWLPSPSIFRGVLEECIRTQMPQRFEAGGAESDWVCCVGARVVRGKLIGFRVESRQVRSEPGTGQQRITR